VLIESIINVQITLNTVRQNIQDLYFNQIFRDEIFGIFHELLPSVYECSNRESTKYVLFGLEKSGLVVLKDQSYPKAK